MSQTDCLFCKMAGHEMDVPMVHEDDEVFAIRDINPRAPVHILIIPKAHISSAREITDEHGALLARMAGVAKLLAMEEGVHDKGYRLTFNVGEEGGQTVFHLHMHLLGGRRMGFEG
jgi:histidine triad (HIT) family protein